MAIGYGHWETGGESPVSIVMLVSGVVPTEVSSYANCDLYSCKSVSSSF